MTLFSVDLQCCRSALGECWVSKACYSVSVGSGWVHSVEIGAWTGVLPTLSVLPAHTDQTVLPHERDFG